MKIQNLEVNLNYESAGPELQKLSHNEINNIVKSYYSKSIKVSDIIEKYHLNIIPNRLSSYLPYAITDKKCPYDKVYLIAKLEPKSYLEYDINNNLIGNIDGKVYSNNDEHCPICDHQDTYNCYCDNCKIENQKKQEIRREAIYKMNISMAQDKQIKLENIGLRDRLILGALLRGYISEDMTYIHGINQKPEAGPFLLNYKKVFNCICRLIDNRILIVAKNSDIDAFVFDTNNETNRYYPLNVNYILNIDNPFNDQQELIDYLCYPNKNDFLQKSDTYFKINQDICLEECEAFLLNELDKVGFNFNPGAKTNVVFKHLLDQFREGQVFYLITNQVTKATRFYQEYNVSKQHAANTVISNVEHYGEIILAKGWNVTDYHWPYSLKRSQLSKFFFYYIAA